MIAIVAPAAVSVYLGGWVLWARKLFMGHWAELPGEDHGYTTPAEALALAVLWPIWGLLWGLYTTWQFLARIVLGDLR